MESDREGRNENPDNKLESKMAGLLVRTNEELKRGKDNATTQSFLDSKPLIDELERLKAGLASARNRYLMSNMIALELESELEATTKSIISKEEEEAKATGLIKELSQALDESRDDSETLKLATHEERRAISKLKQVLRLKRQKLRTSQLTLRATRMESEAFVASAAEALRCLRISETYSNVTLQLTGEQFHELKRSAEEKGSLADWRISMSMEQKQAAVASRDYALSRLQGNSRLKGRSRMTMTMKKEKNVRQQVAEEQDLSMKADRVQENRGFALPNAQAKLNNNAESSKVNTQRMTRSKSNNYNRNDMRKKKKTSIFRRMKYFIVRSMTRLFA